VMVPTCVLSGMAAEPMSPPAEMFNVEPCNKPLKVVMPWAEVRSIVEPLTVFVIRSDAFAASNPNVEPELLSTVTCDVAVSTSDTAPVALAITLVALIGAALDDWIPPVPAVKLIEAASRSPAVAIPLAASVALSWKEVAELAPSETTPA
jgi:hypothetical protein